MANTKLDNLSPEEKMMVAKILKEYSDTGKSEKLKQLMDEDWEEIPVDIVTFCHDKKYLGNGLTDAEGRYTIFPFWEEKLKEIFPTNTTTAYNTLILTGGIGLGKTLIGCVISLYLLYRLLCLKDPYLYYGLQPIDKITISFLNITIDNARAVAGDKFNQLILSSEWFMSHGEMAGTVNLEYRPNKGIEVVYGSSNNQIIGRALFCLEGDTLVETDTGISKIKDLVNKKTRFKTYNKNLNKIELSDICYVKPTLESNELIEIELIDGTIIKCTPNHKFLLKDGTYKEAKDLTEDDEFMEI